MITTRKTLLSLAVIATVMLSGSTAFAQVTKTKYLTIGDSAPVLKPDQWLKGTPVPRFEKGKLYVVEFWATWCGPCKENIPNLTRLAAKYKGQVSIIGVDIWENAKPGEGNMRERVAKFVKGQGAAMNYIVAADGPTNTIADSWMKPAGQDGIPCTFIVGKDGKIAWIGHPASMEPVLEQVVAGTYDPAADKAKREAQMSLLRPINEAMSAKDYPSAVTAIGKALDKKPDLFVGLAYSYLMALFHTDPKKGMTVARKILTDNPEAGGAYQMIGSLFATEPGLTPDSYAFGITVLDEAFKKWPADYMYSLMKANVYAQQGDTARALQLAKDTLTLAENSPNKSPQGLALIHKFIDRYEQAPGSKTADQ